MASGSEGTLRQSITMENTPSGQEMVNIAKDNILSIYSVIKI